METLTDIFSHVCGQGRCFVVDGSTLPVCQRCMGLYVGVALTAAWLVLTGLWRRGLPSWSVFVVNILLLSAAILGGLHVIDPGPAWRLTFGLWTGHVIMLWLTGGAQHLLFLSRRKQIEQLLWRRRDKVGALAAAPLLVGLAFVLDKSPILKLPGWWFWSSVIVAGAVCLSVGATLALAGVIVWALRLRTISWHGRLPTGR